MKLSKDVDREAVWLDFSRPSHAMPILRLARLLGLRAVRSIVDEEVAAPAWMPSDVDITRGLPIAGDFRRSSWLPMATWDVNLQVLRVIPAELSWTGKMCAGSLYHPNFIAQPAARGGEFSSFGCSLALDRPELSPSLPHYTGAAALPEEEYLQRVLSARVVALSAGVVHCQLALNFPHDKVTLVAYGNDQRDNLHHVCTVLKRRNIPFTRLAHFGMPAIMFTGPELPLLAPVSAETLTTFKNYIKEAP